MTSSSSVNNNLPLSVSSFVQLVQINSFPIKSEFRQFLPKFPLLITFVEISCLPKPLVLKSRQSISGSAVAFQNENCNWKAVRLPYIILRASNSS